MITLDPATIARCRAEALHGLKVTPCQMLAAWTCDLDAADYIAARRAGQGHDEIVRRHLDPSPEAKLVWCPTCFGRGQEGDDDCSACLGSGRADDCALTVVLDR